MRSLSRLLRATRVLVEEPLQMPLTDLPLPPREEPPEEQGPTADELRQQALAQAECIRQDAERDAAALYASARQAATEEGRRLGEACAWQTAQAELRRAEEEQSRQLRLRQAEGEQSLAEARAEVYRQVTELAAALAGHILRTRIDADTPRIRHLAEETFETGMPHAALHAADRQPVGKGADAVA